MDILLDFLKENSLRLKDMFFRLDKDHSGDISRNEFKHGLKEMGILMDSVCIDFYLFRGIYHTVIKKMQATLFGVVMRRRKWNI